MPMHTSTITGVVQDMFHSLDRFNRGGQQTALGGPYIGSGGSTRRFV
jgi:hypothetical protein